MVATNQNSVDYGKAFDSISVCLSKGLGAPVGSILLGDKDFIHEAKRVRKALGGGMRQAGIIAATGIISLNNMINQIKKDHDHVKMLVKGLKNIESPNWLKNRLNSIGLKPISALVDLTNFLTFDIRLFINISNICNYFLPPKTITFFHFTF